MQVVNKPTLGKQLDKPHAGGAMSQPTNTHLPRTIAGEMVGCDTTQKGAVIMATASQRIDALESSIGSIAAMLAKLAGDNADNADDTGVTTVADKPATRTGRNGNTAKSGGRRAAAENADDDPAPEKAAPSREKDPTARCTVAQAQYASYVARAFTGLARRQSRKTGKMYYAGVKREKFNAATEKAYNAHIENATRELLAAFNLYADDDAVNVNTATYGELWQWLQDNAPVSANKA